MKKFKFVFGVFFLGMFNLTTADEVDLKNLQFNSSGFYRLENKKEADYNVSAYDKRQSTQMRINVSLKADLTENYGYVFFAPQFSKLSGQDDFVLTSTTPTASAQQTSGAQYDPRLDIHEAYFAVNPTQDKSFTLFAGRQELSYGDQLIMGAVPWSRFGRSFDAFKIRYIYNDKITTDIFTAKLQENNYLGTSTGAKADDSNLNGFYVSSGFGNYFNAVDLYFLRKNDFTSAGNPFLETTAIGLRLKSKLADTGFDYRTEYTYENTTLATGAIESEGEYQLDIEAGYTFPYHETHLALEYFDSSKNFDQLFPTGHKFLGFADQFSRRNISGYVAHFSASIVDKLSLLLDYHIFKRHDDAAPAYNFTSTSLGSVGSNKSVANELDIITTYNFTSTLQASLGYAWVAPGSYIKDQSSGNTEKTEFSYLQLTAKF